MELTVTDFGYLGLCLEWFFFGLYSGIFAMYLQHHALQKRTDKAKNISFDALLVLYALSAATTIIDMLQLLYPQTDIDIQYHLEIFEVILFPSSDFIAQLILIYRCWIMWGYSIRVVIVPAFLAFAFLAISMAPVAARPSIVQDQIWVPAWANTLNMTGLTLSMTVNALVTGLIVFRIFKVFQEVKTATADDQIVGSNGGNTLRRIIFILIESGMALFSIQLVLLVVTIVTTDAAYAAFNVVVGIHEMLNGIAPTIILVRVSMRLSFHDESSMEANIGSLRFVPGIPNSIPENRMADEEIRHDNFEIQSSGDSDIQMVDI